MGSDPFLVASSLSLAVAQRLVRRPCPQCAQPYLPDADLLALLGLRMEDLLDATPLRGHGCADCGHTGYRGRTAVYEVLTVDAEMRRILMRDPSEDAVLAQAKLAGMQTLRGSALAKAMDGRTTFEEVLRVTTSPLRLGQRLPGLRPAGRAEHGRVPLVRDRPGGRPLRRLRQGARRRRGSFAPGAAPPTGPRGPGVAEHGARRARASGSYPAGVSTPTTSHRPTRSAPRWAPSTTPRSAARSPSWAWSRT